MAPWGRDCHIVTDHHQNVKRAKMDAIHIVYILTLSLNTIRSLCWDAEYKEYKELMCVDGGLGWPMRSQNSNQ